MFSSKTTSLFLAWFWCVSSLFTKQGKYEQNISFSVLSCRQVDHAVMSQYCEVVHTIDSEKWFSPVWKKIVRTITKDIQGFG